MARVAWEDLTAIYSLNNAGIRIDLSVVGGRRVGAAVAELLTCSPSTEVNRFHPRPGHSGFSHVEVVPDDAACLRVFSGISRFPSPFIPALLYTHLNHPHRLSKPRLTHFTIRYSAHEGSRGGCRGQDHFGDPQRTPTSRFAAHFVTNFRRHPAGTVSPSWELLARGDNFTRRGGGGEARNRRRPENYGAVVSESAGSLLPLHQTHSEEDTTSKPMPLVAGHLTVRGVLGSSPVLGSCCVFVIISLAWHLFDIAIDETSRPTYHLTTVLATGETRGVVPGNFCGVPRRKPVPSDLPSNALCLAGKDCTALCETGAAESADLYSVCIRRMSLRGGTEEELSIDCKSTKGLLSFLSRGAAAAVARPRPWSSGTRMRCDVLGIAAITLRSPLAAVFCDVHCHATKPSEVGRAAVYVYPGQVLS
ncbi:hypothetical protein PR048_002926 [Dryococelus australis]|uniref:Uncharacterized protein n=1 Tax=Dryococelus australis TaxID=614101 RepID=A0ABQ9IM51_9NEOP|nr:hypothetical protein PR048_002926 [Dryococelus australis]